MATVNLYLDKRRAKKDGTYPLKLIVYTDGNKNKRYSFNRKLALTEVQFLKLCSKNLKNEKLQTIKKYTDREIGRALDVINQLGDDFTYELFEAHFLGNKRLIKANKNKVFDTWDQYIEDLRKDERFGSAHCYERVMWSVKKFMPDLQIRDITPKFCERYEKWFLGRGNSLATLQGYFYAFRTIINVIIKKFMSRDAYPFGLKNEGKYEIAIPGKSTVH